MTQDTVEFVLAMKKIIEAEFEEDPRTRLQKMKISMVKSGAKGRDRNNEDESNSEDEEDREYINNQMFRYKH